MNFPKPFFSALIITIASTIMTGCDSGQQQTSSQENTPATTTVNTESNQANSLTEQEKQQGWELLFDGQDLTNWRGYKKESVPEAWTIDDNALHFSGKGAGGDIITQNEYEDFELALDWKIAEGGNSGIFYNVVEDDKYDAVYYTGPEMQVLDDERHPDAKENPGKRIAGANYDLYEPTSKAKTAGEWNSIRLVKKNNKVEHWMNGKKVVEYELGSDKWKEDVKNSKFASMPDYGKAQKGHIALQDHGDKVWFKNIKIRPL